jgi:hypothetical protein
MENDTKFEPICLIPKEGSIVSNITQLVLFLNDNDYLSPQKDVLKWGNNSYPCFLIHQAAQHFLVIKNYGLDKKEIKRNFRVWKNGHVVGSIFLWEDSYDHNYPTVG